VLNYDIPSDAEDYVHRVGRTARADKKGVAISFVNEKDQRLLVNIERLIDREVPKLSTPEEIGESPEYTPNSRNKKKSRRKPFKKRKSNGHSDSGNNRPKHRSGNSNRHRNRKPNQGSSNNEGNGGQKE